MTRRLWMVFTWRLASLDSAAAPTEEGMRGMSRLLPERMVVWAFGYSEPISPRGRLASLMFPTGKRTIHTRCFGAGRATARDENGGGGWKGFVEGFDGIYRCFVGAV